MGLASLASLMVFSLVTVAFSAGSVTASCGCTNLASAVAVRAASRRREGNLRKGRIGTCLFGEGRGEVNCRCGHVNTVGTVIPLCGAAAARAMTQCGEDLWKAGGALGAPPSRAALQQTAKPHYK